jgi:hypothetical protein
MIIACRMVRSPGTESGMVIACRIAHRRTRRREWSSRAVWPVAGHGVRNGRRVPYGPSPDRVPYRPSPDTASRMVVACRMARRRPRRQEWSSRAVWPVAGSRAVWPVAGSRAVWPVAGSRPVVSLPVSATSVSLPCPQSGIPKARHLPCPGPTWRCSRRRPGGLRTFILLSGHGVLSWRVRRRG